MLNNKDYCDYETCVALKELGYVGQGRCYYDLDKEPHKLRHFGIQVLTTRSAKALNFILAVHLYGAQKWLREEKKVEVNAFWDRIAEKWYSYINFMYYPDLMGIEVMQSIYDSYEEALSEGLRAAIKILKEK